MSTLLLRLTGPMQAWGTQSRFSWRDTGLEPSKSGVIGLLCAALGRPRSAPVDDLARLRMGVRVDREGTMHVDFHTAGGWHRRAEAGYGVPDPEGGERRTQVSRRFYLADADFLVGLEGDEELLVLLDRALAAPRWQLFLGRKSFVPAAPVRLPDTPPWGPGLRPEPLETALRTYPWLGYQLPHPRADAPDRLRLVLDAEGDDAADIRMDVPISFAERRFSTRAVRTVWIATPPPPEGGDPCTSRA